MNEERQKENIEEAAHNAFTGYAVVVLGVVCFLLLLVVVTAVVRLIVGAGAAVGV